MNPYVRVKQKKYVKPGQKLEVMYGVRAHNQLYYQIDNQTFISAEFVNLDLKQQDVAPYQDKQILAKPQHKVPIYRLPENQAKTKKKCQLILCIKFRTLMAVQKACGYTPL